MPSGTGYLKELMTEPEKLLSVFEKAREALKFCVCNQDPEKDGCYRCVFAYRRSREMAETSRDTAVEMLDRILAHKDELEEVPSLGGLTINATFDSELEARFVEALRRIEVDGARAVQVRADLVRDAAGDRTPSHGSAQASACRRSPVASERGAVGTLPPTAARRRDRSRMEAVIRTVTATRAASRATC